MSILDWIFTVCLFVALLFIFLSLLFLLLSYSNKRKSKDLKMKRPKNKRKRKRWMKMRRSLDHKGSSYLKRAIFLFIISILFGGGGAYASYYQMMNLSTSDSNAIVQAHFLVDEIEKTLVEIQNGGDVHKFQKQLLELNSVLVSYGGSTPSIRLTKENQRLLVRYYTSLREYGANLYGQNVEQLSEQETITTYLEDLKKLKTTEKKIFKLFKVNEAALKQKK
ncbi:YccF domain-containing protein [Enterococcus rotai]|uniref:YccF domain-containing protein n=1 Tax=Enterococcus rotai TaxID=118060 RepID=UPI0032B53653